MAYHLRLLGSFRIIDPPTTFSTKLNAKDKCVLAYLAINPNKSVARETIRKLVWPDAKEANGRHSLSQSIYALTKAFPGEITSDRNEVRLSMTGFSVDVQLARNYAATGALNALDSLIGESFLADLNSGSSSFDDWKDAFNAGFYRDIEVRIAKAIQSIPPTEYRLAHEALISLASKLPEHTLLRHSEQLLFDRLTAIGGLAEQGERQARDGEIPFLGRRKELAELKSLWAGVITSARGSLMIIEGDAGQGKSRLLDEVVESCSTAMVIRAQCYEAEQHVPLNIAIDLLSKLVDQTFTDELPEIYKGALAHIFPSLEGGLQLPKLSQAGAQRRLYESMLRLVITASKHQPLLIVVDDLQWADDSTLAFLHFANRRLVDAKVLTVLATRPSKRVRSTFRNVASNRITLKELQHDDIQEFFKGQKHSETAAERAMALTGGNPFLLTEHFKSGSAPSPQRDRLLASREVGEFVHGMIARLSRGEKHVIAMLAAIGVPVSLETLYELSDTSATNLDAALRRLRRFRIINRRGLITFRHDIIRERVYRMIPRPLRTRLHSKIFELFRRQNATPDALAFQAFRSGDKSSAYEYAVSASTAAEQRSSIRSMCTTRNLPCAWRKTAQSRLRYVTTWR
jgi:hypothetical protein